MKKHDNKTLLELINDPRGEEYVKQKLQEVYVSLGGNPDVGNIKIPTKWAEIIRHVHGTMKLDYKLPNESK